MPLIGYLKDVVSGWLSVIVLMAALAGSAVWFHWAGALQEDGPDRARLDRKSVV